MNAVRWVFNAPTHRALAAAKRVLRLTLAFVLLELTVRLPLAMPCGLMRGTYQTIDDHNEQFDIEIAPFTPFSAR
jgi:hypothetical protein